MLRPRVLLSAARPAVRLSLSLSATRPAVRLSHTVRGTASCPSLSHTARAALHSSDLGEPALHRPGHRLQRRQRSCRRLRAGQQGTTADSYTVSSNTNCRHITGHVCRYRHGQCRACGATDTKSKPRTFRSKLFVPSIKLNGGRGR